MFNGPEYDPRLDAQRLKGQIYRVFELMRDERWRTLSEISQELPRDSEASISAQLRHLRKPRFGMHTVNKRRRGEEKSGLWEYQLIVNGAPVQIPQFNFDNDTKQKEMF